MSEAAAKTKQRIKRTAKEKSFPFAGIILLFASLAFTFFRFGAVTRRMLQSLKDLGKSALYYFTDMLGIYGAVQPTVTEIPSEMPSLLPDRMGSIQRKNERVICGNFR